eukprot:SAG31_NODE_5178_length_2697_cov_3.029638_2_plen_94_part_00
MRQTGGWKGWGADLAVRTIADLRCTGDPACCWLSCQAATLRALRGPATGRPAARTHYLLPYFPGTAVHGAGNYKIRIPYEVPILWKYYVYYYQ